MIRVGRFAGQYAKPRSADTETRDGVTLPSYRGDLINRRGFTPEDRTPDPELLLRGYERAALTLNFIRGLVDGGFADLHHPELWDLDFVNHSAAVEPSTARSIDAVGDAVRFMETIAGHSLAEIIEPRRVLHQPRGAAPGLRAGADPAGAAAQRLVQPEHALPLDRRPHARARRRPRRVLPRHRQPDRREGRAHDRARRTRATLSRRSNPDNEPGRLTLIHRFGAERIEACLPPLVEAVAARPGKPCSGAATRCTATRSPRTSGIKTRNFDDILGELSQAFEIHDRMGSILGGVHFELTGENVTECIGGARGLSEADLDRAYRSDVDPRLNYEQALEMALLIARRVNRKG